MLGGVRAVVMVVADGEPALCCRWNPNVFDERRRRRRRRNLRCGVDFFSLA